MILLGFILGLIFAAFFYPNKSGGKPLISPTVYPFMCNGSIIIPVGSRFAFHIHHWIIFSFVLLLYFAFIEPHQKMFEDRKKKHFFVWISIAVGFVFAMIIHGLFYKDCLHIIVENPYTNSNPQIQI